jgi:hypothetical protein
MLVQSTPRSWLQVVKIPQCIDHWESRLPMYWGCHFLTTNYSAECRTRRNRQQFRRNSACFAEEKNLGIQFQTISQKRKTLGIPFQTISQKRKPSEFCSEPFLGREKPSEFRCELFLGRNPRNCIVNHFWIRKTSEFHSEPFLEEKNPRNSILNYFRKRKNLGIPFRIIFKREKKLRKRQLLLAAS